MTQVRRLSRSCLLLSATLVAACQGPADPPPPVADVLQFAGSDACSSCHEAQFDEWLGSHHHLAMQVADRDSMLGDFDDARFDYFGSTSRFYTRDGQYYVSTNDAQGNEREYRIGFAFGVEPLQQYLVEFPDGRLQTLPFSWDSRPDSEGGQRWFHVYGDDEVTTSDPRYWTGPQQNWNYMCAECHSTNLDMAYDLATDTFATTYSEISVGCEACHGPGSDHIAGARAGTLNADTGLPVDLDDQRDARWRINAETGIAVRSKDRRAPQVQPEGCGRCHARRGIIAGHYEYGRPLADTHRPALLDEMLYQADGQILDEVYVYGSFLQSRMYRAGVTCSDCHNPHSAELHAGANPNDTCSSCHLPSRFASATHTGHEAGQAACVDCHMPSRTYMVVDDRRDHSFRIPRPDLSTVNGTPNACNSCHADKEPEWATAAIRSWYGERSEPRPHYGTALAAGRGGFANPALSAAAKNEEFPGIARATALSLYSAPLGGADLEVLRQAIDNPDPLVRMASLRQLAMLPAEVRIEAGGASRLADPVRGVRLEAVLAYAGLVDLLPVTEARAFAAAADEYRAGFRAIANRPEAHASLGDFEMAAGNVEAAMRHFEQALEIDPGLVVARANLADAYRALGDEYQSEAELRTGIALDPGSAALRHALGLLLARTGRLAEALEELRLAAESGDVARYDYVLGVALNSSGEHAEAIRVLRHARETHPTDFDIAWGLATMLRDRGDLADALAIAEELATRHPDNSTVIGLRDSLIASQ